MFEHGEINHVETISRIDPNNPMTPMLNINARVMNVIAINTIIIRMKAPAIVEGQINKLNSVEGVMRIFIINCSETPVRELLSHLTSHV